MLKLTVLSNLAVVNMSEVNSIIFCSGDTENNSRTTSAIPVTNAAEELLQNGILVETKKGLVCMSLRDALKKGVGGSKLSAEDFQTVAKKLLFQEKPTVASISNNSKKSYKLIKKTKVSLCKTPIMSILPNKTSNNTLVDNSTLNAPEYVVIDKVEEESAEKIQVVPDTILNKVPLINKRSLIIKNKIKPVISIEKSELNPESVLINSGRDNETGLLHESYVSCEETSDNSEVASGLSDKIEVKTVKKRGGWPKGRKRKPEVKYEIRPPKAPATGYVIFLNEKRKDYRDMPFTEVTKLLGNEWSKLSLQEKKVYLDQAEVEKKRYREELKAYRQSDAYQSYLHKKRLKRLQGHGTEESDMDATDEIDEEDNEELYCRSCDQWFHSLHNKKEHLYGRQHLQSLAGRYNKNSDPDWCNANMSSTSLDESSLDGSFYLKANKEHCCDDNKDLMSMDEAMIRFMVVNKEREEERKVLRIKLQEVKTRNQILSQELQKLNETIESLTCTIESEKTTQILLEQRLFNLLNVPTLFYLPEPLSEENN